MKKIISIILVAVLLIAGTALGVALTSNGFFGNIINQGKTTYSINVIEEQISKISELTTLKYSYRNADAVNEENAKILGIDIPFTDKNMVVAYNGIIKFGTDLSKANVELVDGEEIVINVSIEPCKIVSHEIDEESWEYLNKTSYIFNPLKPEDADNLRKTAKKAIEKKIEEKGIYDEANENAKEEIEKLLTLLYPDAKIKVNLITE